MTDGPSALAVQDGPCTDIDCSVEIDPTSGAVVKDYGSIGYNGVFGLAFWGGKVYGFPLEGTLLEVIFGANSAMSTEVPFPSAPAGLEFFGAGSATSAPVDPIE